MRDSRNNTGIPDVRITITPTSGVPLNAVSGNDGTFAITGLLPGRYTVAAIRSLWFQPPGKPHVLSVTIQANDRIRGLTFDLLPTAVVSGKVLEQSGAPARGAQIELLRDIFDNGQQKWVIAGQAMSDDLGDYRLFDLQPDAYYVRAFPKGGVAVRGARSAIAPTYYGGTLEPNSASQLTVRPGDELNGINLTLPNFAQRSVLLKVVGAPTGSAVIFLVVRQTQKISDVVSVMTDSLQNNQYRIRGIDEGSYAVFGQAINTLGQRQSVTLTGQIKLEIGREDLERTVTLTPNVSVRGRLLAPAGLPTGVDLQRIVVSLRPVGIPDTFAVSSRSEGGVVMDNGTFIVPNLIEGEYRLQVTGLPPEVYVESARYNGRDVLNNRFNFSQDPTQLLDVSLAGPAGALRGLVQNAQGEPSANTVVVLIPSGDRRYGLRSSTTDDNGAFTLRGIPPGEYGVLALEEVAARVSGDPEAYRTLKGRAQTVTISRGVDASVTLQAISRLQ